MFNNPYFWDELAQSWSGGRQQTFAIYREHIWRIMTQGTRDTIYMVSFSSLFAIILGLLIGLLLYVSQKDGIYPMLIFNRTLGFIVNIGRSIPFVVLIMLVFPLSRIITGRSIGPTAAIVPLTIAAIPFMSRIVEAAINDLGHGIIEAAQATGATPLQIIFRVLLPEAAPGLVLGFTLLIINLLTFSAMAGLVGGGGLGQVAQSDGVQRHRQDVVIYVVIIMVALVQIVQVTGQFIARRLDKR